MREKIMVVVIVILVVVFLFSVIAQQYAPANVQQIADMCVIIALSIGAVCGAITLIVKDPRP